MCCQNSGRREVSQRLQQPNSFSEQQEGRAHAEYYKVAGSSKRLPDKANVDLIVAERVHRAKRYRKLTCDSRFGFWLM